MPLDAKDGNPTAWIFKFTRSFEGFPTLYSYLGVTTDADDLFSVPYDYEYLSIGVSSSDGISSVLWHCPYEVIGVSDRKTEFMDFKAIMSLAESVLPLKFDWYLREYDSIDIEIYRIALGYMRVQMMDDPNRYELIPVWDFYGNFSGTTKDGDTRRAIKLYDTYLTINAMTGMVIDRAYGY